MKQKRRGRKPTDPYWVQWIRSKVVNEPRIRLSDLERAIKEQAKELGRSDYPAPRTIQRIRAEIQKAGEDVRREYEYVRWPETFERGDLPWEAARCVLTAMAAPPQHGFLGDRRLPLRQARWLWWITQSTPHLNLSVRSHLALALANLQGPRSQTRRRQAEVQMLLQVDADSATALKLQLLDWQIEDEADWVESLEAAGKPVSRDGLEYLINQRKEVELDGQAPR